MPPRDKLERGLETPRQARLTVMCIFGVLLFLVTVFGALVVDRWIPMGETRIIRPHFPATVEIPMMAALAFLSR